MYPSKKLNIAGTRLLDLVSRRAIIVLRFEDLS